MKADKKNVNINRRFKKCMKEIDVLLNIKTSRIKSLHKRFLRKSCSQLKKRRRKILLKPDENEKRLINKPISISANCTDNYIEDSETTSRNVRLGPNNCEEPCETGSPGSLGFLPYSCGEDSEIASPGSMRLQPDSSGEDSEIASPGSMRLQPDRGGEDSEIASPGSMRLQPDSCG